ncbi:MAG: CotH kinase family protein [Clostridium sp.]|nr:CotH kinase family protein [Clostridium sp.]MCM1443882.1 CotH kinase family protein [Candidatus Amulumruptor caecigallinarius]
MFNIKKGELKKNYLFILVCFLIVIIFVIISLIMQESSITSITPEENGENSIPKLVINEVVTSNNGIYSSSDSSICDFVEIFNGYDTDINLLNYGLSDNETSLKWAFPDVTIKSKEYLIVNLCGESKDGLYAPFKLKSSGEETIILTNPNKKVIDSVTTSYIEKGNSMGRDLNGSWHIFDTITPGYENSMEGYNNYINSLKGEPDYIKITEILPNNDGNFKTNGKYYGYIELTNTGDKNIDLSNYTLSNDEKAPFKYKLPSKELKPNEVVIVYTTNKNLLSSDLQTGFKLESNNGNVILGKNGKIIENQRYSSVENGLALIKYDNEFKKSSIISPGYLNSNEGIENFNASLNTPNDLIINEVMNNNFSYLPQNGYNYYDWIELKNNSNETINLKNYNISTKETKMFDLPDVELKPNEYYIIMCSGDTNLSNNSYVHTNFKISETESIFLFKNNEIIDSIVVNEIPIGYSYGRNNNNKGFYYINTPTPKRENNSGTRDISITPSISLSSGIYNNVDKLEIVLNAPGTIYYTLDGSTPTTSSKVYSSPIYVDKTTVLKAMNKDKGKLVSNVITNSYIVNENHTLPVMSVSLNPSDFTRLQATPASNIEYNAYAELYEKDSSFSIPCGIKLFGGSTRSLPKKSFSLKFKKKFGASKLNYQVFDNRDFSSFDTLVLRSGSQDYKNTFLRDILGTSLVDEYTDVDVQAYKSVILYINGRYWGIYNIREKVDETFISNHYNVNPDYSNIMRIDGNMTAGSSNFYSSILNYVRNNDMSKAENFNYIKEKINIENMADYWIAELFVTNNDIINCRFFSHKDVANGKLHFIFYDLDYAWYNYSKNYYNYILNPNGMQEGFNLDTSLLRNMMKNSEFKKIFLQRLSYNLNNTWKTENVLRKLDEIYNYILPEMERDGKRWGYSLSDWNNKIDKLKDYINKRTSYLLKHTKSQFGLSDTEMKEYFGDLWK